MKTVVALAWMLTAATPGLDEPSASLEMQPVELRLPDGSARTAYRGTLRVPIVRANPESKEIGVDVWRFPADEGVPEGRTPVFVLHGGPGWRGREPEDVDWEDEVAPMVAHGDLVLVGQRGIGTSTDTSCSRFARPIDPEATPEERRAAMREQCGACRAHWEAEGYDLRGFNVIEAAGDVDDVRRLLGYETIAIFGGSFGSHWGMAVQRFHPEAVARAVLHGMEGPNHTYDSPSGVLGALERIDAAASSSPELAGRVPEDGLVEALRLVIDSLEADPIDVEVGGQTVRLDADAIRHVALGYEGRVRSRESVAGWPRDVMRLYQADFEPAARAIAIQRQNRGSGGLPTASYFQLDCGSGITEERLEKLLADPAIQVVGDLSEHYETVCPAWDADLGDGFRAGFTTDIPTVVVHGTWDVSTPYDNALECLEFFEDLRFVTIEGGTHGAIHEAMRHDPSFRQALMAFLCEGKDPDLPERIELPPIRWNPAW